jgi:hypothetical protein
MLNAEFKRVAENIVIDRTGTDYYRDARLLTNYIRASFDLPDAAARKAAEAILADRAGANYYQDPNELARFFAGSFKASPAELSGMG